jgi:type I restriction enzyme R subunit
MHADIVVSAIKRSQAIREIEDAAVKKITGSVDKVQGLIRYLKHTN